jgi:hypothetical protein
MKIWNGLKTYGLEIWQYFLSDALRYFLDTPNEQKPISYQVISCFCCFKLLSQKHSKIQIYLLLELFFGGINDLHVRIKQIRW